MAKQVKKEGEFTWVLLEEKKSQQIDHLISVYKENPLKARILYHHGSIGSASTRRLVMYRHENSEDFEICDFEKKVGISTNNRLYEREKKIGVLVYKKRTGFYYLPNYFNKGKSIQQLTFSTLLEFINHWSTSGKPILHPVIQDLMKKFTWIRFIGENPSLHDFAFNSFIKHKLFNLNDALKHYYKGPLPMIKIYLDWRSRGYHRLGKDMLKTWREMLRVLYNIENLRLEMLNSNLFLDALRMGKILNKRINCSWSLKRLKAEHDRWSNEITDVVIDAEPLLVLNLKQVYLDFGEFSGYRVLRTNKELMREGLVQHHCVGTYSSEVERGICAIYHVKGYTLELRDGVNSRKGKGLFINQLNGRFNELAPSELREEVQAIITQFNLIREEVENKSLGGVLSEIDLKEADMDWLPY